MTATTPTTRPLEVSSLMTRPERFLTRMILFLVVVGAVCGLLFPALRAAFLNNAPLNGVILATLLAGIAFIFRQVLMLRPEVAWLEQYQSGVPAASLQEPVLLAPMARMLGERRGRLTLSALSMRSLLDGIASRLDESRELSRYLIGLLIFLGLLGTFWGLLHTVQSVGGVIGSLSVQGGDVGTMFSHLQQGLEAPLVGMGTAFSSSLFGLAGSLVLGFLELQASQAHNRFFQDLEDWLSSATRLSSGAAGGLESGDHAASAYLTALLEQTAENLDALQRTVATAEEGRRAANANLMALTERLSSLTDHMRAEQQLLLRLGENQLEVKSLLDRLAESAGGGFDDASRQHLRNMDIYLARIVEESSNGRVQAVQEIRSEIKLLARTIAALAEEADQQQR
ncbi:flagellar motor protein MotA [Azospirillum ramasamyi]|uniref:Flagellar motor protein MotA n=2 Tax=Azospirillum ramasamyi TaxID=682998 RepID=A0A2U9S145_9PROT|nr:flagellar motor protein MotA [Azospirillum ramasamyi]AWU93304.1 flagellar motor protein MotA [Azospirillum ramasamyi]